MCLTNSSASFKGGLVRHNFTNDYIDQCKKHAADFKPKKKDVVELLGFFWALLFIHIFEILGTVMISMIGLDKLVQCVCRSYTYKEIQ